jgi:pimeloyl-ACP methyl ester carboxylesterase
MDGNLLQRFMLWLICLTGVSLLGAAPRGSAHQRRLPRFEASSCPFQRGDWAPEVKLECGHLVVPENRARPGGRTIRLAVGILRAAETSGDPPLVWFGSTGSALQNSLGRLIEERLTPDRILPVTRNRDFVVFDLRGTGLSEPALCPDFGTTLRPVEADAALPAARQRRRAEVRRCVNALRAQGIDRAAYNAVESAADLGDLRRALRFTTWDVYGGSYGARVVLEALRRHPQAIRSAVLEDPLPTGPVLAERPLWAAQALQRVLAACRADHACHSAFPTSEEDFFGLYEELERTPVSVAAGPGPAGDTLILDGEAFVALFERALHFPRAVALIPLIVHELRRGDRQRAVREIVGRSGGRETRVAWYLTNCYDQYGSAFEARWESVMALVGPPFRYRVLEDCDLWQDRFAPSSEFAPVHSEIPTLILMGELSIEPPAFGRRIAATLSKAFVYEFPGRPHGDRPTGCPAAILSQFLADPTRAPDASCIARMPPLTFVTRWPDQDRGSERESPR